MPIRERTEDSIAIVEPLGDLGLYNLDELRRHMQKLRDEKQIRVIVDLSHVPGIDSITIGFLIKEHDIFNNKGGALILTNLSHNVRKSLMVTETLDQLNVFDSVELAKKSLS